MKELQVKESLIKKLSERNSMLELLMKKSVTIMKNPLVMKDAFRRFNFSRYVYTNDGAGAIDVELTHSEGELGGTHKNRAATISGDSNSNQSPHRIPISEMLEDTTSERLPARRLNKNLIKVESYTRKMNHNDNGQNKKAKCSPIRDKHSTLPINSGHDLASLSNS